ncbi:AAA family ATPase [Chengkuizengella axinellae]|uniref:AAA family ATPase n=1 Tax=Chengkuizengella axinellae TaxID=3064388 RepID=A0ABT9IWW2_9BACL|nr:AAA family ATPase [Chengkuizengella sp. 2205SS18-9]MDP5273846.1 AAA family ATPase [Chengkuizengella sp. 2205SS18-9]
MKKYGKEIALGFIPVLIFFLVYIGVNVIPLLVFLAIGIALLYFTKVKGTVNIQGDRKRSRAKIAHLTFDDIGGQDSAKKELKEALDFLIHKDEIAKLGIRPLKGILLTGPPGTGKTLLAKASAQYTNSIFVSASGSEFVEKYVGVGASRIRDMFKEAKLKAIKEKKESIVVFIDEIDVIGGKRDGGQHREYDQTLNQLLTEMDGIHTADSPRILMMAATNRKEMLDSALLRPGRFDRQIQVDLPDKKGRFHILNIHAKNKPISIEVDLNKVAAESYGFSGAQLESVMNEAAIYAMREKEDNIHHKHLSLAIDKVMMGEKTDRESTQEERKRVALHELGHAIAAELVRPGSVSQVSLSPRGQALGFVRHNPQKDQYLYTKNYIEEQIQIALGGSVAEQMYYGGRSTGSRNDFEKALQLTENMIYSGLTDLGIVNQDMVTKEDLLKTSTIILDNLTHKTREQLESYRYVFDQSLQILMDEEVLSGDKFRELMQSN